ncbi:MAG: B12-binding domain-containing radical SAM protein [Chitinispirillaceae bacterium]|nr:B12-binding domain-containing radical SAM protein [Chitinispirillaceae bacterium]
MILYLINPDNPLVSMVKSREYRWNRYSVWKPLGLLVIAGLTPPEWTVTIVDENIKRRDYAFMPTPDLVGITAFTSQANRAYVIAREFRERNVPVIMGGIHATMCSNEALERVDTVVTGEAESIWPKLLDDFRQGSMKPLYAGTHLNLKKVPTARHDLLPDGYFFGSIQTSRGCPLSCSFCSVTAFNGGKYRRRPIENVIDEFRLIKEKNILIVDDNFIGISKEHLAYVKDLLRALIKARLHKKWVAQVTINMADDEELLTLAAQAGCEGVFIGFESTSNEGLEEIDKRYIMKKGRNMKDSIRRIHRHGIIVVGSFIIGLDIDKAEIGHDIADKARQYDIDALNVMFLTPLPGTKLWDKMFSENRIIADNFPHDWQYYTLTFPVASCMHLSWYEMLKEKNICYRTFYSYPGIIGRVLHMLLNRHSPLHLLVINLWYRKNTLHVDRQAYTNYDLKRGHALSQPVHVKLKREVA